MEVVCKIDPDKAVKEDTKTEAKPAKEILCAVCSHKISDMSKQIIVNNAHEHTFANPHGIVFQIGCYSDANGCIPASIPSSEFSWFPGYTWRIGICRSCSAHLGWIFLSDNDAFYGLIIDKLIFP
ncbi:MAG: hypothetical protein GY729_12465 [Desulfobacteraceae bacterium]|nr:hypothetical protein [Desulfobacteraceae bacterium]